MTRPACRTTTIALTALLFVAGCGGATTKDAPSGQADLDVSGKIRLAQVYVEKGRIGEALSVLEDAIADEPGNASVRKFHGQVSFIAGRHEQAEASFKKALELDPYLTDVHNDLGALYDKMGRKVEAEAEFKTALEDPAYPTPEMSHLNLALLYLSQGRTEEGIDRLRTAVEIDPKYYQAHYELASVLDREGKLDEAAREYEVAAPGYRGQGDYHFRLGFTYMRLGDSERARENLNRVIEVSPGSRNAVRADELLKMLE